jgi:heme exporter protein CcmD
MNWSKLSMGEYAFYVWGSYLVALLLMGGEVFLLMKRWKALRQQTNRDRRSIESDGYETSS